MRKMTGTEKTIIAGIGVVSVAGIGYYLASGIINPSCTTKGSACNTAITPYTTQFNDCWNNYMSLLTQYTAEDAKAGTGISSAQQSRLNEYLSCANAAAKNIATTAKKFNQNPLIILATFVGEAFLSSFLIYFSFRGGAYYRKYVAGIKSVPAAKAASLDAAIDYNVNTGVLDPADASGMKASAQDITNSSSGEIGDFYDGLATEGIITETEAEAEITDEESIVSDDLGDILDILD